MDEKHVDKTVITVRNTQKVKILPEQYLNQIEKDATYCKKPTNFEDSHDCEASLSSSMYPCICCLLI